MRSQYAGILLSLYKQHQLLPVKIVQKGHVIVLANTTMKKRKKNKMMQTFPLLMETTFWALAKCLNLL